MKKIAFLTMLSFACVAYSYPSYALNLIENQASTQVLPAEKAFAFEVSMKKRNLIELRFATEPGYRLYKDKIHLLTQSAILGKFELPTGKFEHVPDSDKKIEIYDGFYSVLIPVSARDKFTLYLQAQGCANVGVCYPPFKKQFELINPK